jgi:hypothetical protein
MGQPYKRFAVKKLKRPAGGELQCVPREAARRDEDAAVGTRGRHNSEQLSYALDRDLAIEPVLALHNHPLRPADKLQVDTAIGLRTAAFPHRIALLAEGLTD